MSVFGHTRVEVVKNAPEFRWEIFTIRGASLVNLQFKYVYLYRELSGDLRDALDACVVAAPLTEEEREALLRRLPQLRQHEPLTVDPADFAWESPPVAPPRPAPVVRPVPKKTGEVRRTFDRKIR